MIVKIVEPAIEKLKFVSERIGGVKKKNHTVIEKKPRLY